jgi:hypothetical protein
VIKKVHYLGNHEEEALSFQYNNNNNKIENKSSSISLADILKSISDDKSLLIFWTIGDTNSNGELSLKKLGLSNKQYYSRISAMM